MNKHVVEQTVIFFSVSKWLFLSSAVGIMIGGLISVFLNILSTAEQTRSLLPFPFYFTLPFALMLTTWIVRTFDQNATGHGTEKVIEAVHKRDGYINAKVIPVKLVATVLTIFSGGSVGKEGPGAQIGAGAASFVATLLKFSRSDRKKLVICGISAGFASVFGTPIAGAIFGIEVLIIGVIMYDVLLPSFIAGFAAFTTAQFLGVTYHYYDINMYRAFNLDFGLIGQVVIAGVFFGIVSDLFITAVNKIEIGIRTIPYNRYLKAFVAGLVMVIVSYFLSESYLGLGLGTIRDALSPSTLISDNVHWYDFIFKTIFTAITLGSGGSGGIITPVFYVGATSGVVFGHLTGDHIALFAALGFVSVLAGTTNSPIASIIMAVELFGVHMANYAALSVVIAFLITGHRSVFQSQKLALNKADNITIGKGNDLDDTSISIDMKDIDKVKRLRNRLRYKSLRWQVKNAKDDIE
ncbi:MULTISPECIES: chloride channel protein [unclassified Sulfurospirillum]|uniref:chloride channel protein n=1 Tax=unclassified Sulfurospirillum TaxID=2618290 RepID=UPI0005054D46|nr:MULTISPECIES: chloride channel protein [unclassified Sulfurospirillum]KFL33613.1 voltage-gated chloride channel [Sulfurospirillum sp. SCADC]